MKPILTAFLVLLSMLSSAQYRYFRADYNSQHLREHNTYIILIDTVPTVRQVKQQLHNHYKCDYPTDTFHVVLREITQSEYNVIQAKVTCSIDDYDCSKNRGHGDSSFVIRGYTDTAGTGALKFDSTFMLLPTDTVFKIDNRYNVMFSDNIGEVAWLKEGDSTFTVADTARALKMLLDYAKQHLAYVDKQEQEKQLLVNILNLIRLDGYIDPKSRMDFYRAIKAYLNFKKQP